MEKRNEKMKGVNQRRMEERDKERKKMKGEYRGIKRRSKKENGVFISGMERKRET